MSTILITGANRGLGLEFTKQYLEKGWQVIATARSLNKADKLQTLKTKYDNLLQLEQLELTSETSIKALSDKLRNKAIDVLLNNAGVFLDNWSNNLSALSSELWLKSFHVNTIAPILMAHAFLEQVSQSEQKKLVFITSQMGSIGDNQMGGAYAYRSSKAALNMAVKTLSLEVKDRGVTAFVLHPGWVKTDMGGENAPTDVADSIASQIKVIENSSFAQTGHFLSYNGSEIVW